MVTFLGGCFICPVVEGGKDRDTMTDTLSIDNHFDTELMIDNMMIIVGCADKAL